MKQLAAIACILICALPAFSQTRRIAQLSHSADALELSPALPDNFGIVLPEVVLDSFVKVSDSVVIKFGRYEEWASDWPLTADTFFNPPHIGNTPAFIDSLVAEEMIFPVEPPRTMIFKGFDRRGVKVLKPSGELNWKKVEKAKDRDRKKMMGGVLPPASGPGDSGTGLLAFWLSLTCAGMAYGIWAFQSSKIQATA